MRKAEEEAELAREEEERQQREAEEASRRRVLTLHYTATRTILPYLLRQGHDTVCDGSDVGYVSSCVTSRDNVTIPYLILSEHLYCFSEDRGRDYH